MKDFAFNIHVAVIHDVAQDGVTVRARITRDSVPVASHSTTRLSIVALDPDQIRSQVIQTVSEALELVK